MSLEELDNLIKTMEGSISEIKNYQTIYKELTNLQGDISNSIENLNANKDALDKLNSNITESIGNLKKQVEELNSILPQKMLEIVSSNKDIQIDIKTKHEELLKIVNTNTQNLVESFKDVKSDIKTKHEELIKLSNDNTEKNNMYMKKLSIKTIVLTIMIVMVFMLDVVEFVMKFIK